MTDLRESILLFCHDIFVLITQNLTIHTPFGFSSISTIPLRSSSPIIHIPSNHRPHPKTFPNQKHPTGSRQQITLKYPNSQIMQSYHASPIVEVRVGASEPFKTFRIHQQLLEQNSQHFQTITRTWTASTTPRLVTLPHHHPDAFEIFAKYIYNDRDVGAEDEDILLGTQAYLLGVKLVAPAFQERMLQTLRGSLRRAETMSADSVMELMTVVYVGTSQGDPLRQVLAGHRWAVTNNEMGTSESSYTDPGFNSRRSQLDVSDVFDSPDTLRATSGFGSLGVSAASSGFGGSQSGGSSPSFGTPRPNPQNSTFEYPPTSPTRQTFASSWSAPSTPSFGASHYHPSRPQYEPPSTDFASPWSNRSDLTYPSTLSRRGSFSSHDSSYEPPSPDFMRGTGTGSDSFAYSPVSAAFAPRSEGYAPSGPNYMPRRSIPYSPESPTFPPIANPQNSPAYSPVFPAFTTGSEGYTPYSPQSPAFAPTQSMPYSPQPPHFATPPPSNTQTNPAYSPQPPAIRLPPPPNAQNTFIFVPAHPAYIPSHPAYTPAPPNYAPSNSAYNFGQPVYNPSRPAYTTGENMPPTATEESPRPDYAPSNPAYNFGQPFYAPSRPAYTTGESMPPTSMGESAPGGAAWI